MKQSSLTGQAVVSTAGVLVQGLARFAYSVLIGRVAGATELGEVTTWLSLSLLLSLLWPTAAGNAASHYLALVREDAGSTAVALRFLIRTFWYSVIAMLLIGVPIALFGYHANAPDAAAICVLIVTYSGYIFARGVLVGLGRIGRASLWDAISSVTTLTLLAFVLVAKVPALLLWPITIGYAVFFAYMLLSTRSRSHEPVVPQQFGRGSVVHTIAWNSVGIIASNGLIQVSMLYVYATVASQSAGHYAAAMSLATPASMLAQAISQILIPRFTASRAESPNLAFAGYLRALAGFGIALAVVFAVVVALTPILLSVLYGSTFTSGSSVMQLLLIGIFAFSIGLLSNAYLLAVGRVRAATICSVIGLLVGVATIGLTSIQLSGDRAAAIGVMVGYVASAVCALVVSLRRSPALAVSRLDMPPTV